MTVELSPWGGSISDATEDETVDELRDYDLRIIQPRRGYRFSVDPLLLCDFAGSCRGEIIDLGTGCGVMALIMARKAPDSRITGIEFREESARLAERNGVLNGLHSQVTIIHADILQLKKYLPVSSFDLVLANPPFRRAGSGKISPHAGRDRARHESTATLEDFLRAAKYLVKPTGRICLIYHVSRLAELLSRTTEMKLALLRLRFVHGGMTDPARVVLLELVKGRNGEVAVLPPLFVSHGCRERGGGDENDDSVV
jgi:tRNA1Val (adenine37-N6)-methyltransferase